MKTVETILRTLLALVICGMLYLIVGAVVTKKNTLLRQDSEYLYYKEYTLYNKDSCVYKYHKPITYEGIISDKRKSGGFVGVPGKGGHYVHHYKTEVLYNNKTYLDRTSSTFYRFNKGEKVTVTETFYPRFEVEIQKKQ